MSDNDELIDAGLRPVASEGRISCGICRLPKSGFAFSIDVPLRFSAAICLECFDHARKSYVEPAPGQQSSVVRWDGAVVGLPNPGLIQ